MQEGGRQRNQAAVGLASEQFQVEPGEPARRRSVPQPGRQRDSGGSVLPWWFCRATEHGGHPRGRPPLGSSHSRGEGPTDGEGLMGSW